jgi:hypothetical protein
MNDIPEERDRLLGFNVIEGPNLDPLGEFVDGDHQVREAPRVPLVEERRDPIPIP